MGNWELTTNGNKLDLSGWTYSLISFLKELYDFIFLSGGRNIRYR